MKNIAWIIIAAAFQFFGLPALAVDLNYSAKSDIWGNPFLAYGYNPKTKIITGYLAALRTAPGRTDECKVIFKGTSDRLVASYLEDKWVSGRADPSRTSVYIKTGRSEPQLAFSKSSLGGDCDWILPFGTSVSETNTEIVVPMKLSEAGNWVAVYVIAAKRARLYSKPNNAFAGKAYLVKGNLVYVYQEQPEWYFVRFKEGKKTAGWIRIADTVQP